MSRSQHVQARNQKGDEVSVRTLTTDSPLLPVAQLEWMQQFRPDLVDFVVTQTALEADHRRKTTKQVNLFIFIERIVGTLAALFIGVFGTVAGAYVGLSGQPALGGSIVAFALGTLAVAFLRKKDNKGDDDQNGTNGRRRQSGQSSNK
jgi:hypothetical protein